MDRETEKTCPSCGSTASLIAALCPHCDYDLAKERAEVIENRSQTADSNSQVFRKSPGLAVFTFIVSGASITISVLLFMQSVGPGKHISPIGYVIVAALAGFGLWLLYFGIRSILFKAILSPRSLTIGKHHIPFRNVRFSSSESVQYRSGARTSSFSIYYRNQDAKGVVLIPGTIRNSQALVEALQEIVTPEEGRYELKLHCPYCGNEHEKDAFPAEEKCSFCGKVPETGIDKLDVDVERAYTGNRVGSWVVMVIVAAAIAVYFSFTPRFWDGLGGVMFVLFSLFIVLALLYPAMAARRLYTNEKQKLRYVDVLRPVQKED